MTKIASHGTIPKITLADPPWLPAGVACIIINIGWLDIEGC
jgi:hypothetical protein